MPWNYRQNSKKLLGNFTCRCNSTFCISKQKTPLLPVIVNEQITTFNKNCINNYCVFHRNGDEIFIWHAQQYMHRLPFLFMVDTPLSSRLIIRSLTLCLQKVGKNTRSIVTRWSSEWDLYELLLFFVRIVN